MDTDNMVAFLIAVLYSLVTVPPLLMMIFGFSLVLGCYVMALAGPSIPLFAEGIPSGLWSMPKDLELGKPALWASSLLFLVSELLPRPIIHTSTIPLLCTKPMLD